MDLFKADNLESLNMSLIYEFFENSSLTSSDAYLWYNVNRNVKLIILAVETIFFSLKNPDKN